MKRHKSVAAILLIMVMIITMMSAMVFAANVKYWGDEFATVTDEDGSTFMTVRTFGSDGLIKAQAIGEPGHEAPTDETGEVATRYFYKLDGSALVYGDDNKALDGSTWTQDAFKTLESQVRVRLVAPPYVKDYNAQSPAAAVLAPDDFIGWKVELEVSDYDDTQTYVDQRITVSIKLTPDVEINGTAAAPVMYGSAASAAITVKGEGNDPTTAKVYLDAANEDNYATFSGGALTGLYDGETHTVVADTFPGYTVSYEVWDAAPGRYIPVDSVSITDVKEILFRVVYTDKKTSAQIQTQGISLNLTPAKGAYIGFKLLDPEDGWVYSVEGSDYSITDYIAVEPMNNKPYSTDAQVGELEQLADAACAKAVSKNEAEIISYFNELYEVVESVSEDTPNLVDLAIVPRDLTVNEKTAIAKKYEVLTRNISQVKPGEGIAYSEVDNTARIILNGMTDHTLTHQDAVEATCTSEGNQEYWKCSVCGRYFKDADAAEVYNENEWKIGKKDHTLAHQEAVAATCTAEGNLEYWKCSVCKQYFKDAAATETYDENEWKIVKAAHTLTHQAAAEATCTAEGNQEYWKCSVCEQYFKDAAATEAYDENEWKNVKTAHTLAHQEAVAATCTSEGNQEYWKCSECGQYFKDAAATETYSENAWVVGKKDHDWNTVWTNNETKHWHKCKNCDVIKDEAVHSGGTATCKEKAKCEICEAEYGSFADHNMTHHPKVAAGANTIGNKEYWECSVCHKHFKDAVGTQEYADNEWIIPATGGGETPAPGGGGDTPSGGGGTDSEDTEVDAVQQVADQINALNEPYDAAKVKAAREAYDKLTDEQKKDSKLTDEMIKKLSDAEAAVESTQAVGKVSDMIRAIPDDFAKATSDQVSAAVEAYHSLTAEQKKLIDASDLEKLQSALNYPAQVQKVLLQSVSMKRGKQVVVKWKKNSAVNGYQLYLKAKGTKAKKISINKETKVKESVKKLKAGKSYNIKVRTYVEVEDLATGNPVKVYGQWSKVKKAKAKR